MPHLLGIDLGTQSVKTIVLDGQGSVRSVAQAEYPILTPRVGWAEQQPQTWWKATCRTTRQAIAEAEIKPDSIAAVGLSGQMHGTVCMARDGLPRRPAIIWADGRSAEQVDRLVEAVGRERLGELTANPLAAGFMAATARWLRDHEPDTLDATSSLILPKDYIRFRLTRQIATDHTDAASTLLYDVAHRCWSDEMIALVGIERRLLPRLVGSHEVVGTVTRQAASGTGIPVGTPVVAGGGDQPVAAVGQGVVDPGVLLVTLGTGGQLFTPLDSPAYDPELRTHTFVHAAPGRWYVLGAILSAGLCLRWLRDKVYGGLGLDYDALAAAAGEAPAGAEGLLFAPYLLGERTPHMDARARGLFFGLALRHGRPHLVRAVMEGVAFAIRDALDVFRSIGVTTQRIIATGGGARSGVWRQILADVLGAPLATLAVEEPAARGAALLAGIGTGVFASFDDAVRRTARPGDPTIPRPDNVERYHRLFPIFKTLYPRLKDTWVQLQEANVSPGDA